MRLCRGEVKVSGYYGRKIEGKDSSRVWYIVQADPKVMTLDIAHA